MEDDPRPLVKPQTLCPMGAQARGAELLADDDLRVALRVQLERSTLPRDAAERFLVASADMAADLEVGPKAGIVADQLARLADRARELQQAMTAHSLSPVAVEMVESEHAARRLAAGAADPGEGTALSAAWDAAAAVEAAARAAKRRIRLDARTRQAEETGEVLVSTLVDIFVGLAGRLPPGDQRGWFVEYSTALGAAVGLVSGARTVASVLGRRAGATLQGGRSPAA